MTEAEHKRVASYLRDYAQYLSAKSEKEYSAIVQLMIRGAISDIENLCKSLDSE